MELNLIPPKIIEEILSKTSWSRQELKNKFPINLGRGIPHKNLINYQEIIKSHHAYWKQYPTGFPTYKALPIFSTNDPNTFRGFAPFVSLIVKKMKTDFNLIITEKNIITGSNGGFELINFAFDILRSSGYEIGFTNPTFNRGQERILTLTKNSFFKIKETAKGVDLNLANQFFKNSKKALYLVPWGGNPNGSQMSDNDFLQLCQIAQKNNGKIIADGAYLNLYFNEKDKPQLAKFKEFILNGTLILMMTATKEGGSRGPAFLLTAENSKIFNLAFNTRLSVIYDAQGQFLNYYQSNKYNDFLKKIIRPQLKNCFNSLQKIFNKKVKLSNENVQAGYNVEVILPVSSKSIKAEKFYKKLSTFNINTKDSRPFYGKLEKSSFRIPFGGFSVKENILIAMLIRQAHKEIFD